MASSGSFVSEKIRNPIVTVAWGGGRIAHANRAFLDMVGLDALDGRPYWELLDPEYALWRGSRSRVPLDEKLFGFTDFRNTRTGELVPTVGQIINLEEGPGGRRLVGMVFRPGRSA